MIGKPKRLRTISARRGDIVERRAMVADPGTGVWPVDLYVVLSVEDGWAMVRPIGDDQVHQLRLNGYCRVIDQVPDDEAWLSASGQ